MPSGRSEGLGALLSASRIGKFLSVGVAGAAFDITVLSLLVEVGELDPSVGKIFSAEAAIVAMFAMNERWTFAGHGGTDPWDVGRRFLRSNVVRAGGALWALGVLHLLTTYADVWYLAANVVGIGTGFVINYVFESVATWRVHR